MTTTDLGGARGTEVGGAGAPSAPRSPAGLEQALRSFPGRCAQCGHHVKLQGCRCADGEWQTFLTAVRSAAVEGRVHQRDVRPLVRGRIEPKHIGQQYKRAIREGLLAEVDHERSNDTAGRNSHRMEAVYELRRAA